MSFGREGEDIEKAEEERILRNIQKKKVPNRGYAAKKTPHAPKPAEPAKPKSKEEEEREAHEKLARERLEQQKKEEEAAAASASTSEEDIKEKVRSVFETAKQKEAEARAAREKEAELKARAGASKETKWKKPEGLFPSSTPVRAPSSPPTPAKAAAISVAPPTEDSDSLSSAPPEAKIPVNATPTSETDSPRTEVLHESVFVPKITYKTHSPYKKLSEEEKEELRRAAQREAQASLLEAGFLHRDKPKEPEPEPVKEGHVPAAVAASDPALAEAMKLIGQSTPAPPQKKKGSLIKATEPVDRDELKRRQAEAEKAMREAGFM